jgi:hypothetical protein
MTLCLPQRLQDNISLPDSLWTALFLNVQASLISFPSNWHV